GNNENVLADMTINGAKRKVLLHADRNGFLYVLDRTNGQFLAGNAYVPVNWAKPSIDPKTGRPDETDVANRLRAGEKVEAHPRCAGGKHWFAMAYSPGSHERSVRSKHETSAYRVTKDIPERKPGGRSQGVDASAKPRTPGEAWGSFSAFDPMTAKTAWAVP